MVDGFEEARRFEHKVVELVVVFVYVFGCEVRFKF